MKSAARLLIVADPRLSARAMREAEQLIAAAERLIARAEPGLLGDQARVRLPAGGVNGAMTGRRRDFLIAAAVAQHVGPADERPMVPIAIELSASARHGRVMVAPHGTFAGMRALLAPPLVAINGGLRGHHSRDDEAQLAARIVAELIAAPAGPGLGGELEKRLVARCEAWSQTGSASTIGPEAAFAAWIGAWRGLVEADEARLRAASDTLSRLAADHTQAGVDRARLLADLALVSLALGGAEDGGVRLAQGLEAARAALGLLNGDSEPALRASIAGLIGRLAGALGIAKGDHRLLEEARDALRLAMGLGLDPWLAGACGLDGLELLLEEVERARPTAAMARAGDGKVGKRWTAAPSLAGPRENGSSGTRAAG